MHDNKKDQIFLKMISEHFPDIEANSIDEIIEEINALGAHDHEKMIMVLIDKILTELAEYGIEYGLSHLNSEEKFALEEEINHLVLQLKKEGKNVNSKQVVQFIIESIHKRFKKKYEIQQEEDTTKTPEQIRVEKKYKEFLMRMVIYEMYKIINPNRIAGETAIENFINNVRFRGLKFALQHEVKSNHLLKQARNHEEKSHREIIEINKGKNLGIKL